MDSIDHSNLHLMRSGRRDYINTPSGKVALFIVAACPELRPFKGVILQYLQSMTFQINAEGGQAVARFKSYKSMFLEVVSQNILPSKKYKHALPIYRIAVKFRDNPTVLGCLNTVMRFYDLWTPGQSKIDTDFANFRETFMVPELGEQSHEYSVLLEDEVFDFRHEVQQVVQSRAFRDLSRKVPFSAAYEPQEKAILLSKHGTATFKRHLTPHGVKGFAPSIVGATAELERAFETQLSDGRSLYDLQVDLGNAIGSHSWPSMKFTYRDKPPSGSLQATLRRNVCFGAPGFKSRVIAIGDYTSQYVLSPLHSWAFEVLRRIESDYTFSHEKGFETLSGFTRDKSYVACFDLSNATDALPVTLSETVLASVAPNGQIIAPLWRRLLTELPFDGLFYKSGQPMGLLSSWSVGLALTHHFIVWIAANRAGMLSSVLSNSKNYYGIVGDDIYICHPAIAHYYSLIMNAIGCKINLTKSLLVTESQRISEFVKRNSFDGDEITALSPKLIVKSFNDYVCARELILKLRSRVLLGPRLGTASSVDEQALIDLYGFLGHGFVRAAIGTMCSIPTFYAGLSDKSDTEQWPPLLRTRFLVQKALTLLEFKLRSIYINASGQDVFNTLVMWSLEDLVPGSYFRETQLIEYIRKSTLEAQSLLGLRGIESNQLMAELAQQAWLVISKKLQEPDFSLWETDFQRRLLSFTKPPDFSIKAIERKETRSLAFKIFKSIGDKNSDLSEDFTSAIN